MQDDRRCQGPQHSDSHVFHNILLQHDLIAVNTWQHGLGPTYRFQNKHSRIDYVICRRHFSDTTSKGVQYLHDFPLNSLDGAQHFPILASLLKVWHHTPTAPKKGWTLKQRLDLYKRWRYPTNQTIQLQQEINDAVQRLPSDGDCLDTIHKTLNDFGHQAPLERPTTWYDTNLQPFQLFQVHSKWLAELTTPALKSWFAGLESCCTERACTKNDESGIQACPTRAHPTPVRLGRTRRTGTRSLHPLPGHQRACTQKTLQKNSDMQLTGNDVEPG